MKKEKVERIFQEALGFVPCDIEMTQDKNDLVNVSFKHGKVSKVKVSERAHFDDVCDAFESVCDSFRTAA